MSEFSMMPVLPAQVQERMRGVSLAKFQRDLQSADLLVIRSQDLPHLAAGTTEMITSLEELLPGWQRVAFERGYGEYRKDISIWRRVENDRLKPGL